MTDISERIGLLGSDECEEREGGIGREGERKREKQRERERTTPVA
jgi:hypothetical protein